MAAIVKLTSSNKRFHVCAGYRGQEKNVTLKSVRNLNLHKDIPLLVTEDSREMLPMVFDKLSQMGQIIRPIRNYS